ncbi:UDP-N-acetylglucosamine 2-epimerase [Krasilnikovia cinnamomea]|uniref:UDP-N-acetylglucosamine 2-epimerase (non-hydrolyzing) n=1 Tax=Krasilnikovia cinnamomea TaxID=349313 RepID=A0A4Q7ZJS7_9ACTN|nr:UDP-N-acetylglucosamine 2-epimerase [Krasilnikovia cinnamomea]RZU50764.1 UDP-N-acetylglucosamine 2-epimerase [Krasilnikovia cinnamomea]
MSLPEVHLVGGTRPEAVRLAPVATAMREAALLAPILIAGGPQPAMVGPALAAFGLDTDVTLPVGGRTRTGAEPLTDLIRQLNLLWERRPPAAVIVHGDTPTSLAGALAAFSRRIPVVHLEAGRRSMSLDAPFPEEADQRLIAQLAALHLTSTPLAAMNLLDENVAARAVVITGTTVPEAAAAVTGRELRYRDPALAAARAAAQHHRLVAVTVDAPLERGLTVVRALIARYPDIYAVLSGPEEPTAELTGVDRLTVTGPLAHPDLSCLLSDAYLVLTDSDGLREEALSFGVPALMLTDTDTDLVVGEAARLLDSRVRRDAMTVGGIPYGDGQAARRVAQATAALLGLEADPEPMPSAQSREVSPRPGVPRPRSEARRVTVEHPAARTPQVAAAPSRSGDAVAEDVAAGYAQAWIDGDRHATRRLLAPDVEVEWNLDPPVDDEELVQTLHRIAVFATEISVVSRVSTGATAAHVYDCATMFGTVRFAEFLTVTDGQITEVRHVYDAVGLHRYLPTLLDDCEQ